MEELIKAAKGGSKEAFTQLMQLQMQSMYKAARALLRNDEDVADAVSETILSCWEKLGQLKYEYYFKTWMTKILINKCNDILRKRMQLSFSGEIPETPINEIRFENAEWKEALNKLDELYRLVMILYYVEGFKTSEISQIMEMPESTVRTRLARGRKQLTETFDLKRRKAGC